MTSASRVFLLLIIPVAVILIAEYLRGIYQNASQLNISPYYSYEALIEFPAENFSLENPGYVRVIRIINDNNNAIEKVSILAGDVIRLVVTNPETPFSIAVNGEKEVPETSIEIDGVKARGWLDVSIYGVGELSSMKFINISADGVILYYKHPVLTQIMPSAFFEVASRSVWPAVSWVAVYIFASIGFFVFMARVFGFFDKK